MFNLKLEFMKEITTVGVDLAKAVYTVHVVDAAGRTVLRKAVRREPLMELNAGLRITLTSSCTRLAHKPHQSIGDLAANRYRRPSDLRRLPISAILASPVTSASWFV
jgi:hypothetical protein